MLDGVGGADTVNGGIGADQLNGGVGYDTLLGGPGADYLYARDGERDILDGGPGIDGARIDKPYDRLTSVEST